MSGLLRFALYPKFRPLVFALYPKFRPLVFRHPPKFLIVLIGLLEHPVWEKISALPLPDWCQITGWVSVGVCYVTPFFCYVTISSLFMHWILVVLVLKISLLLSLFRPQGLLPFCLRPQGVYRQRVSFSVHLFIVFIFSFEWLLELFRSVLHSF
jgi:hypothetical protein